MKNYMPGTIFHEHQITPQVRLGRILFDAKEYRKCAFVLANDSS